MSVRPQIEVLDIFKTVVLTKISITPKCPMYDALQTLIFFGCVLLFLIISFPVLFQAFVFLKMTFVRSDRCMSFWCRCYCKI